MLEFEYRIKDPMGLHARPAGQLVKKAKEFDCEIMVSKGEKQADMRKIFDLLALSIKQNETIKVSFNGSDEEAAHAALKLMADEILKETQG